MSDPSRGISSIVLNSEAEASDSIFFPILIDIRHYGITWAGGATGDYEQQDGHLRLVNNTQGLKYKGDDEEPMYYAPCTFNLKMGESDGSKKSTANITISAIDGRIIEVIRSIDEDLTCKIVALYGKVENKSGSVKYTFSKLSGKEFRMGGVSWNGTSAQWELNPDDILDMQIPRDKGSYFRFPSVMQNYD